LQPLSIHSDISPASSSARTLRAMLRASRPASVFRLGSAPACSSSLPFAVRVEKAAMCSGVRPSPSRALTGAPAASSAWSGPLSPFIAA
jgi:hypothetical protein